MSVIKRMKKEKILIVDDNEQLLSMMNEFLVDNDYDVVCSLDGVTAKKIFFEYNPDIVITDIVMPNVDGIELLIEIRKINPDIKSIVMSGGNKGHADTYLQMADKLGADVILNKPFQLKNLLVEIKRLLNSVM